MAVGQLLSRYRLFDPILEEEKVISRYYPIPYERMKTRVTAKTKNSSAVAFSSSSSSRWTKNGNGNNNNNDNNERFQVVSLKKLEIYY